MVRIVPSQHHPLLLTCGERPIHFQFDPGLSTPAVLERAHFHQLVEGPATSAVSTCTCLHFRGPLPISNYPLQGGGGQVADQGIRGFVHARRGRGIRKNSADNLLPACAAQAYRGRCDLRKSRSEGRHRSRHRAGRPRWRGAWDRERSAATPPPVTAGRRLERASRSESELTIRAYPQQVHLLPEVAHAVGPPQVHRVHHPPVDRLGVVAPGVEVEEVRIGRRDDPDVLGPVEPPSGVLLRPVQPDRDRP